MATAAVLLTTLPLTFKIGAALVDAPDPLGSVQENTALLSENFPILRFTTVLDSDVRFEGGKRVVHVILPPVKTNG